MSEYVGIGTSAADIIATAAAIRAQGEGMSADLDGLIATVESHEGPDTIANDDFGNDFKKTYYKDVPVADNKTAHANEATKAAVRAVGQQAEHFGQAVTDTMIDYLTVDGEGAASIRSV
jgi:hypothetical protein